jgi:2'-5' RNA ligase
MSGQADGEYCQIPADERLNVFALVIYIPDPLGRFLDDLRRELVPQCNPHAHVSVLPPRPLSVDWSVASGQVRSLTDAWAPFEIELTDIGIFPATDVIYIQVGAGAAELNRMHAVMSSGSLGFHEPFPYHPHVTLAQEIPAGKVDIVYQTALERWREYRGPRSFRAERAAFVQNTLQNCWIDLAEYSLGAVAAR